MKKEVLDKTIEVDEICEDNCTIEETIEQWNALKNKYVKAYHVRHELYRDYGYNGAYVTYLRLYRLETDEEEAEREEAVRIEMAERAEYERLKEKYGEF